MSVVDPQTLQCPMGRHRPQLNGAGSPPSAAIHFKAGLILQVCTNCPECVALLAPSLVELQSPRVAQIVERNGRRCGTSPAILQGHPSGRRPDHQRRFELLYLVYGIGRLVPATQHSDQMVGELPAPHTKRSPGQSFFGLADTV